MYTRTHANAAKDPRRPDASVGHNAVEQHPLLNPTYELQPPGEGDRTPLPDSHNAPLQNPPVAGYRLENLAIAPTARLGGQSKLTIAQLQQHGGQPLPNAERGLFEPRFGQDFSQVKIHTDQQSAEMARSVNARAFTVGRDVVFGAGQYQPRSPEGQRLLAHELTHVVQQSGNAGLQGRIQNQATSAQTPGNPIPAPAQVLPSADELTTRLARCIGIWETNRGQNAPAPKESRLQTVVGVRASMATIEQATISYAITALKSHKQLRDKANPALTIKELNEAEARCKSVSTLLSAVEAASAVGKSVEDFIKDNPTTIQNTGLSNDDVKTMFGAASLKRKIFKVHTDVETKTKAAKTAKEKAEVIKEAVNAIPESERLGIGEGSLKPYILKPGKWGENQAAWQRKAVTMMPDNIGNRVEAVAVSESGTALAIPVIKSRVSAQLAKDPVPGEEEIVKTVAQKNNPNEPNYGKNVWETYKRLYLKQEKTK